MKKIRKPIGWILLIALVVIQFFRPAQNLSGKNNNNVSKNFAVPDSVKQILEAACNDCHSNKTVYPWYASVQPVAWWVANHVNDGKRHLNFDEFTSYRLRKQYHKMEEVVEQIEKDEMPEKSYRLMHTGAKLTAAQKTTLIYWAETIKDSMKTRYPIDSLVAQKK
ncbi:MAG: heme-binding domain-containing protein [Saprospiraceae bacterium]|nr:heme-binding domain-containing protein [Saprospiraceae bacterium]